MFVEPAYHQRSLGDVVPAVAAALGVPIGEAPSGLVLPEATSYEWWICFSHRHQAMPTWGRRRHHRVHRPDPGTEQFLWPHQVGVLDLEWKKQPASASAALAIWGLVRFRHAAKEFAWSHRAQGRPPRGGVQPERTRWGEKTLRGISALLAHAHTPSLTQSTTGVLD